MVEIFFNQAALTDVDDCYLRKATLADLVEILADGGHIEVPGIPC